MDILEWAIAPRGQTVPIHIAWFLIRVAFFAGAAFLIVHAAYIRFFARKKEWSGTDVPAVIAAIPERVPRHSRVARAFHWLMAASMFTLLFTAFLPKVGVEFPWVTYHWIAGTVLTASVVFHVIHASFWLDFWSIWPDKTDLQDAVTRVRRFVGQSVAPPRRFAKYPLENKGFHGAIIAAGLASGLSVQELLDFYERSGASIFSRAGIIERLRNGYEDTELRKLLQKHLGTGPLGSDDLHCLLLVVTRNAERTIAHEIGPAALGTLHGIASCVHPIENVGATIAR